MSEEQLDGLPIVIREDMLLVMEGERAAEKAAEPASKGKGRR